MLAWVYEMYYIWIFHCTWDYNHSLYWCCFTCDLLYVWFYCNVPPEVLSASHYVWICSFIHMCYWCHFYYFKYIWWKLLHSSNMACIFRWYHGFILFIFLCHHHYLMRMYIVFNLLLMCQLLCNIWLIKVIIKWWSVESSIFFLFC